MKPHKTYRYRSIEDALRDPEVRALACKIHYEEQDNGSDTGPRNRIQNSQVLLAIKRLREQHR